MWYLLVFKICGNIILVVSFGLQLFQVGHIIVFCLIMNLTLYEIGDNSQEWCKAQMIKAHLCITCNWCKHDKWNSYKHLSI
jgi:hypothetical protein